MAIAKAFNSCDSLTGWNAGSINTNVFIEGTGSLNLTKGTGSSTYTLECTNVNGNFNHDGTGFFYIYIQDAATVSKFFYHQIRIGIDDSNYYTVSWNSPEQYVGWHKFEIDISTASTVGSPSPSNVKWCEIVIVTNNAADVWPNGYVMLDFVGYPDGGDVTKTSGTSEIATRYPIESGLQARTTRQHGRTMNLVAESSVIPKSKREGL